MYSKFWKETSSPFPVTLLCLDPQKKRRLWRLSFPAAGSRYQLCLRPKQWRTVETGHGDPRNRAKNTINKRIFKALHAGMLMANNTHRHSQILDALCIRTSSGKIVKDANSKSNCRTCTTQGLTPAQHLAIRMNLLSCTEQIYCQRAHRGK